MQLKLDQLITIVWDQNSGHISLNARPNGAVSVRKKLFSEHHGRFSPGRCPQPQRQPQHLQRDDLPGEHIARDHRSHPSRFSFLEQKRFLCFEKDLRFQEKIAETVGVNWEGLAAIIIFYLAVLMVKNLEEKKVIVSPFVDTCICTVRHSPDLSRMCQCAWS